MATATKTKKKESDYAPVYKHLRGLGPNGEVWVENEVGTDENEELNRISMAIRRGPVKSRKGYKWGFRHAEGSGRNPFGHTVIFLKKIG